MGQIRLGHSNGCWLQLHDARGLRGNAFRVYGPAEFPGLRIVEPKRARQALSLIVGPNAYVQCYRHDCFDDSVAWLLPRQKVSDVAELEFGDEIDSVRLYDRPPFAFEPGYGAYMLWAASHVVRQQQAT